MNEPMTLIERLRNPQWIHGTGYERPQLDVDQTRADMGEAAREIESQHARAERYRKAFAELLAKLVTADKA